MFYIKAIIEEYLENLYKLILKFNIVFSIHLNHGRLLKMLERVEKSKGFTKHVENNFRKPRHTYHGTSYNKEFRSSFMTVAEIKWSNPDFPCNEKQNKICEERYV